MIIFKMTCYKEDQNQQNVARQGNSRRGREEAVLHVLSASYQRHLARQQQLCLIMQGFDIIHHLYNKAAVQTLQGSNSCAN